MLTLQENILSSVRVGGFSMGGTMAMHMAFRYFPQVAGVFALSSFLAYDSAVYKVKCSLYTSHWYLCEKMKIFFLQHLRKKKPERIPPILMVTGEKDNFVYWNWVRDTRDRLKRLGVNTSYHVIPQATHQITILELNLLNRWIKRLIPYHPKEE